MLVQAKYQIGYKGVLRKGNEVFQMEAKDYEQYSRDVVSLDNIKQAQSQIKELKEAKNKQLKKNKNSRTK